MEQNVDKEEERRAAEEFREQLQQRSVRGTRRPGAAESFGWLDENGELLDQIARTSWGSAPGEALTPAEFKEELSAIPLPSPYDEPFTHSVVHMLSQEIEGACRELGIPLHSGVAYGSNASLDVGSPFQVGVPLTDASVISLNTGFILFCTAISGMCTLALPHERIGDRLRLSLAPEIVLAKLSSDASLHSYWEKVFSNYASGFGPLSGDEQPAISFPASFTRMQILFSMERFSLAHEYGHHVGQHGRAVAIGADCSMNAAKQEFEADLFAVSLDRYIGRKEENPNIFTESGAAAVLLLKCHDCVKRFRQILMTGDDTIQSDGIHPETSVRIAAFDTLDYQVPESLKTNVRRVRGQCAEIIDQMYVRLKPMYIEMHKKGVRPTTSRQPFDLPRCLF